MIWVDGKIVPDNELKVSVLDRTFEHGLGLFETLRTWNGRATLLERHLARMENSARELGLPILRARLPDHEAVADLLQADRSSGDVILRITMSGGTTDSGEAMAWMRAAPLPADPRREGAVVDVGTWRVVRDDPLARHKTLNYWSRRQVYESARRLGFDEVLSTSLGGNIWEGSRTNLFVVGGSTLVTPSLEGPIVPGVMRGLVLELTQALPLTIEPTKEFTRETLQASQEVFLTNSARGVVPVSSVGDLRWPAPGPWTQRLAILVADRLTAHGQVES